MDITDKLTHTVSVARSSGPTSFGEEQYGTPTTGVKCFIYENKQRRVVTSRGQEKLETHQILFLPDADVQINDKLTSAQGADGASIFDTAYITSFGPIDHYREDDGRQAIVCNVSVE